MRRFVVDAASPDPAAIEAAADAIRGGGLVIVPTDTLYGLAANPFDDQAVERVFAAKGRASNQALPLVASDLEQVEQHIGALALDARRLAVKFWPGPLTILLPAPPSLAIAVSGGTGRVGVRVPNEPIARELCRVTGCPVTATSANRSGEPASADPDQAARSLLSGGADIDVLLDGGPTPGGPPSTIVDMTAEGIRIVRVGALGWEDIQTWLNR
ncbi:MAG TPA: L-threonylcarbamoyladenylate synthase [Vicinamibacterales bacterium]|jgi:L-threonylcarbamoyladenylate synthase|nr:L-threonylcarbamoyladenylate synthase [Vicinamibacterales bacterium]